MNEFNLNGAVPSTEDKRDWDIAAAGIASHEQVQDSTYPNNYMCEHLPPVVYNQGPWPMCVGYAIAAIKETLDNKEGVAHETRCSPGFIYAEREDDDYQGNGERPREALKIVQNLGACAYSLFPDNGNYPELKDVLHAKPNYDELLEEAYKHSISAYYKITTLEEIKYTLMNIGPVLIVVPSYGPEYWRASTGWLLQGPDSACTGTHAMVIVGWKDNDTLIILNSWGDTWGDNGYAYLKFGGYTINEMWAITDRMTPEIEQYYRCKAGQHPESKWEWERYETCDEDGLMSRICPICGEKEYMNVKSPGHTFGFWKEIRKASKNKPARYQRTCSVCGKIEYKNGDTIEETTTTNWFIAFINFFKALFGIK